MKTTLVLDDHVMERVRAEAARRRVSMSSIVEAALRRMLDSSDTGEAVEPEPLPTWRGGAVRVDVADRDALDAAMGGR